MANATNGPSDPGAGTERHGRAERSRAAAGPATSPGAPAAASPRRRTVPATATSGRTPVTAPAEPARKSVRTGTAAEESTRGTAGREPAAENAGSPVKPAAVKPAAVKSTSSRAATERSTARKTATSKAPVEQPGEVVAERPARRRSAASTAEPVTDRAPARRATGAAAEPADEGPEGRTPRSEPATVSRRTTAATEARARRTTRTGPGGAASPEPERAASTGREPERAASTGREPERPEMTRGIVELAAERLAASARSAGPEPQPIADGDPMAAPGSRVTPRAAAGPRRTGRLAAANRPPAGPPPTAGVDRWDGASARNGWLGPPAPDRAGRGDEPGHLDASGSRRPVAAAEPPPDEPDTDGFDRQPAGLGAGPHDQYPWIMNRPAIGLPASVRLPAELPDNLWPPKSLLEQNSTANIHVPAAVPPWTGPAWPEPAIEEDDRPGAAPADVDDRIYVPAAPSPERYPSDVDAFRADERPRPDVEGFPEDPRPRSDVEAFREDGQHRPDVEDQHEPEFLPSVLARDETDPEYVPAHSRSAGPARHAAGETASGRRVRRRRRAVLLAYLLVVVLVLIAGRELRGDEQPLEPGRDAAQQAAEPAAVGPAAGPEPAVPMRAEPAATGAGEAADAAEAGEFGYAKSRGPMLGSAGRLYRFRVAVEKIVEDTSPGEFAEKIDDTLGDERSWINDGRLRLRRVPKAGDDVDFTIYLASARTSEKMCASGGLSTEGFTSCRLPEQVIINADRWAGAVPDYEGRLGEYRQYTINHEVGHELGHGHEACPGEGEKAPVMMQQTFGLKGCTPNAWPYLDGERYAGKPIA